MDTFDVIVIGAGPAGSTSAIRLATAGWSVFLCDREAFPRDTLCGEFLSPETTEYLAQLDLGRGLDDPAAEVSAPPLDECVVGLDEACSVWFPLPRTGHGLSRRFLDGWLVDVARRRGVEWQERCRVRRIRDTGARGGLLEVDMEVEGVSETKRASLVVLAVGRHAGHFERGAAWTARSGGRTSRPRLVAFQRHYRRRDPASSRGLISRFRRAVALYPFRGGYCGINPIEGERENVCFLGESEGLRRRGSPQGLLDQAAAENPALASRLGDLTPLEERFRSVAGMRFGVPSRRGSRGPGNVLAVGDAAGAISPLCGDGVAMAMRSANLASEQAVCFLAGEQTARETHARYEGRWRREFANRIRIGRALHEVLVRPRGARCLIESSRAWPDLARRLFGLTRDGPAAERPR